MAGHLDNAKKLVSDNSKFPAHYETVDIWLNSLLDIDQKIADQIKINGDDAFAKATLCLWFLRYCGGSCFRIWVGLVK